MKIKRFNNLWTMGLIIFGSLLVIFYLLKIIFPSFVVGVAEIPSIVKFGEFLDSHWWALFIVNGIVSYFIMFFYACACCRIKSLSKYEMIFLAFVYLFSFLSDKFLPSFSLSYNFMAYIFCPLFVVAIRKMKDFDVFYSTCVCFLITTVAQWFSLEIREISTLISYPNTATFLILLIDGTIWTVLLYLYFNKEKEIKNG